MKDACSIFGYDFLFWKSSVDMGSQSEVFYLTTSPEFLFRNSEKTGFDRSVAATGILVWNTAYEMPSKMFPIYEGGISGSAEIVPMSSDVRKKLCKFGKEKCEEQKEQNLKKCLSFFAEQEKAKDDTEELCR